MAETIELQKGKVYFMKVAKASFDIDAHNNFVRECRGKGIGIVTLLVDKPEDVSVVIDKHIGDLLKTDWTDMLMKNFKLIEKHASSIAGKKGMIVSEMSILIRNKIKAVLAIPHTPEKK